MSKKNIAKSSIEGGRSKSNKQDRYDSNAKLRVKEREYIHNVMKDPEHYEEYMIDEREVVYKDFRDKLSPVYSYLDSRLGKSWADTRSELMSRFDTRTTAGRHVLYDHILKSVTDTRTGFDETGVQQIPELMHEGSRKREYFLFYDYYVDLEGKLAKADARKNSYRTYKNSFPKTEEWQFAAKWLGNRILVKVSDKLHWAYATEGIWEARAEMINNFSHSYCNHNIDYGCYENHLQEKKVLYHVTQDNCHLYQDVKFHGFGWKKAEQPFSFVVRAEISEEDYKIFAGLHEDIKSNITRFSKGR